MNPFDRGRPRRATAAQPPPAASGLYGKRHKLSGKILYHGETSGLKRRYQEHEIELSVHLFEYQVAKAGSTYREHRRVEIEKIRRDSPPGIFAEVVEAVPLMKGPPADSSSASLYYSTRSSGSSEAYKAIARFKENDPCPLRAF
jgi:hypothetical protein